MSVLVVKGIQVALVFGGGITMSIRDFFSALHIFVEVESEPSGNTWIENGIYGWPERSNKFTLSPFRFCNFG